VIKRPPKRVEITACPPLFLRQQRRAASMTSSGSPYQVGDSSSGNEPTAFIANRFLVNCVPSIRRAGS